jgi:hypothetical protein
MVKTIRNETKCYSYIAKQYTVKPELLACGFADVYSVSPLFLGGHFLYVDHFLSIEILPLHCQSQPAILQNHELAVLAVPTHSSKHFNQCSIIHKERND